MGDFKFKQKRNKYIWKRKGCMKVVFQDMNIYPKSEYQYIKGKDDISYFHYKLKIYVWKAKKAGKGKWKMVSKSLVADLPEIFAFNAMLGFALSKDGMSADSGKQHGFYSCEQSLKGRWHAMDDMYQITKSGDSYSVYIGIVNSNDFGCSSGIMADVCKKELKELKHCVNSFIYNAMAEVNKKVKEVTKHGKVKIQYKDGNIEVDGGSAHETIMVGDYISCVCKESPMDDGISKFNGEVLSVSWDGMVCKVPLSLFLFNPVVDLDDKRKINVKISYDDIIDIYVSTVAKEDICNQEDNKEQA